LWYGVGMADGTGELLAAKFEAVFPHLGERQRRLLMGAEARVLGHGGIRVVARVAGVREATVSLGAAEVEAGAEPLGRVQKRGSGRKPLAGLDPGLRPALLALVEPDERGDTSLLAGAVDAVACIDASGSSPARTGCCARWPGSCGRAAGWRSPRGSGVTECRPACRPRSSSPTLVLSRRPPGCACSCVKNAVTGSSSSGGFTGA